MLKSNWRAADAYTYLNDLGSTAFAWEFLRRNAEYQRAYRSVIGEADANPVMSEPLAQRWGLRFRGRSAPARRSRLHRVAAASQSHHCSCRASPG
jgi:hypothetical protein